MRNRYSNTLPKTPIYIDFAKTFSTTVNSTELNIYEEDPIDIYSAATTDIISNAPYSLAPRYFIIIHRPVTQPGPTIKINIHKTPASLLHNKLRVALPPSIGYGINASYKVEYWEWKPLINIDAQITNKLIHTEYWYVPSIDECSYIATYPFDPHLNSWYYKTGSIDSIHKPRITQKNILVNRIFDNTTVSDTITTTEDSDIFCFPLHDVISFKDNIIQEVIPFNEQTQTWTFSKTLSSSTIVRDVNKADGDAVTGSVETTIRYIKPFHSNQIICDEIQHVLTDANYFYVI